MNPYPIWLVARSVLLEALRRREIYAIVLVATLLIAALMTVDFFQLEGLTKFYREVALSIMSTATGLTVIVLAARQLPREFETRTIYPLLAKPIGRLPFLLGKLLGTMLAAAFCFALFMGVYILGTLYLRGDIPWGLFVQYVYLQFLLLLVLATLGFWLSMLLNLDAAITIGAIFFLFASQFTTMTSYIYDYTSPLGQKAILALTYAIPQLTLLDLSEKAVHAQFWDPLSLRTMVELTFYGLFYATIYFGLAMAWFRRRPL
jgi:ABC-type transport system involved in multi-copper enzyme maturation permease subunit